ncbi:Peptidylprolyl isomerase domain and WD repeat-containing protein 1 [Yarrowia sp. C11]|nr:Peptidylprolyl isomerase domain and WD repeat-containing protein 1 [Yarrowia sp. E02]KAG5371715.1 Peptidylprolyl isomerase domain and WD repeat-containing protein 1 [Yarrowia sp. C11]
MSSSSSDDDFGPSLAGIKRPGSDEVPLELKRPSKKSRLRKVQERMILRGSFPQTGSDHAHYNQSFQHKAPVTGITDCSGSKKDFVVTSSIDGTVKFWHKKGPRKDFTGDDNDDDNEVVETTGIEFVKEFCAHEGEIVAIQTSNNGMHMVTCGADKQIKVYDVAGFDIINTVELDFVVGCATWIDKRGNSLLAVSNDEKVVILDVLASTQEESQKAVFSKLHRTPIICMAYSASLGICISVESNGNVEYWRYDGDESKPKVEGLSPHMFELKSKTDLFTFRKKKSVPSSITISHDGLKFACFTFPDRQLYVFSIQTGKIISQYDESLATIREMQDGETAYYVPEQGDFESRLAVEQEVDSCIPSFDPSDTFLIYPSLLGLKVVSIRNHKVVRMYGHKDDVRFSRAFLFHTNFEKMSIEAASAKNQLLDKSWDSDAVLFATARDQSRFYLFSNTTKEFMKDRDANNETEDISEDAEDDGEFKSASKVTLHTNMGDITVTLFPQAAPKACSNFSELCRTGYYDNTIFHRVIKKFMIQGGDPDGDGTGGQSIWGKNFEDEFSKEYTHDQPFTLSMANAGKGTNGSQFFITTEPTPWLDNKHTVFGRVTGGKSVVKDIEGKKVDKNDKPVDEVRIQSVTVM